MLPSLRILFLCTGNTCRSQMAEGWARHLHAGRVEAYSAGVAPGRLDHRAVAVMAEVGVDMSGQHPKRVSEMIEVPLDLVVTVCDQAREACPVFPGRVRTMHRGFEDPPRLAKSARSEEEALGHYRRVRDEIRAFVEDLPGLLATEETVE
jgi:arsenate reductase